MSIIGSARDFRKDRATRPTQCSECRKTIKSGAISLISVRYGKAQKRVCSHECREIFDDRYWQQQADQRRES